MGATGVLSDELVEVSGGATAGVSLDGAAGEPPEVDVLVVSEVGELVAGVDPVVVSVFTVEVEAPSTSGVDVELTNGKPLEI